MHTISSNSSSSDKAAAASFSFEKSTGRSLVENFNCSEFANEDMHDVVESFETLHQSIPWLQQANVSSDSHKGQLKILQAAIDYIIDLEEQLTEHLSEDLYRVAIQQSKAALQRTLANHRRPFADVNYEPAPLMPALINAELLHSVALQDEAGSTMERLS